MNYNCNICEDEGYILITEWTDTDTSYEVEVLCICQDE